MTAVLVGRFRIRFMALWLAVAPCAALGCGTDAVTGPDAARDADGGRAPDSGRAARAELPGFCARPGDDAVRDLFCAESPPAIRGLQDLQNALELVVPDSAYAPSDGQPGYNISVISAGPFPVFLGHSTALSGFLVSPINPRVILLGDPSIMAFQRGVQRVELITRAHGTRAPNFYLLEFEQACNRKAGGCRPGDLYTSRIESDWVGFRIRDDEELKNTALDCRQCHQRARDTPALLMRELEFPWTHFIFPFELTDAQMPGVKATDLMADYVAAKQDELYAGVPMSGLSLVTPFLLQVRVDREQPLLFDAPAIQAERWPDAADGDAGEPLQSATWNAAYAAFKRGEQLALPYVEQRATDPEKQAALTEAYRRYRAGEISAEELPDLADIFPDDPRVRAQIGLQAEPDASPVEALIQACGSCHNDVLDQSISRARFSIDLSRLDRAALDRAIERLELAKDEPGAMPPPEARQLDLETRARLIAYLEGDFDGEKPDPRLVEAARLGMAGGGGRAIAPTPGP